MTITTAGPILHLIRRLATDQRLRELPDQELLGRFSSGRDEAAFSALLRRHGSMVLDVCRNILGNEQDAEDAFQATLFPPIIDPRPFQGLLPPIMDPLPDMDRSRPTMCSPRPKRHSRSFVRTPATSRRRRHWSKRHSGSRLGLKPRKRGTTIRGTTRISTLRGSFIRYLAKKLARSSNEVSQR